MWIYSKLGFFSVVKTWCRTAYIVRARRREDLEVLIDLVRFPWEIVETRNADYRFRIFVSYSELKQVFLHLSRMIEYPNFKSEVDVEFPERSEMHHTIHEITADALDRR